MGVRAPGATSTKKPSPWRGSARWLLPATIALAEYLLISVRVDAESVKRWGGEWSWIARLGMVAPLGVVVATTLLLFRPALRRLPQLGANGAVGSSRHWLFAVHAAAYALLFLASERIFGSQEPPRGPAWIWLGGWALLALGGPLSLFGAFGHSIKSWAGYLSGSLALAALVAGAAWVAGVWSVELWEPLSRATLAVTAGFLGIFFRDVSSEPAELALTLRGFAVEVAPICSGFEGLGLMFMMLAGYLVAFRSDLRFPRAFLLIPLGLALVWLGNCVRIALLMVVGAYIDESLAIGAFHSKAGWIFFCVLVLAIATLGQRSAFFSRTAHEEVENRVLPFLAPLLATIGTAIVTGAFETSPGEWYGARVVTGALVVWLCRRSYAELMARPSAWACLSGALVGAGWLLFVTRTSLPRAILPDLTHSPAWGALWKLARVAGAVLVIPIVEELAFRGYLQRWLIARDFWHVSPKRWTWQSLLGASLAFGLVHDHVVAGTFAGLAFGVVLIRSGRVVDAVASHAVANLVLVSMALATGNWTLLD